MERVVPARLGTPFRWLLGSSWVSNIGDGIAVAAGPLLVASESRDPRLVAAAWMLQLLPHLLFGLFAGVIADRVNRRRLVAIANVCRVGVLLTLVGTIVTGEVNIVVVLTAMFLLGTGETFADTTTSTLLPMVVAKRDLGVANARFMAGIITLNQLAGPPLGAFLFALGRSWPFLAEATCIALSIVLVLRVQLPEHGRKLDAGPRSVRKDIVEGLGWLWRHAAVRTLVLTIFIFNITFGAAWSVLVLYSLERLDMGAVGFGLLTSAMATGGILGTVSYSWLESHVSLGNIMRVGLVIETLTHLALAVNTVPWIAMGVMVVFGAHAFVWGTTSTSVRQRAVPTHMQGRVASVYQIGMMGGIVVGSVLGGLIAGRWGVTGPFWFGFVGSAVFLVLIWRQLLYVAHADEENLAAAEAAEASGTAEAGARATDEQ